MFKYLFSFLALVLMLSVSAGAAEWNIDAPHSSVGFSVRHLVVSKTTGHFTAFSGTVNFDGQNVAGGSAEWSIQVASIDTDDKKRDDHLRGADFFDVEKFPAMTFKSKKVIPGEDRKFQLLGDLTIKGITKEVTFDVEFNGAIKDPWGGTRAGFSAGTSINRQDFGISWNKALDTGGLMVGNTVNITMEVELVKAS
jgi:polyisoprenoid-binding protein YceI